MQALKPNTSVANRLVNDEALHGGTITTAASSKRLGHEGATIFRQTAAHFQQTRYGCSKFNSAPNFVIFGLKFSDKFADRLKLGGGAIVPSPTPDTTPLTTVQWAHLSPDSNSKQLSGAVGVVLNERDRRQFFAELFQYDDSSQQRDVTRTDTHTHTRTNT